MKSIVDEIIRIFDERGYEISPRTAAECWRRYSIDSGEVMTYVDLPEDQKVFEVVVQYENEVRIGMDTHLVKKDL